ncbi:MAG TPA: MBL fold metallo-hydrolase [Candidatus Thermoplasmatota archaeon]|nr:MBL fold metallo-hydrolase [Candidatus Thermoplasmatota archaeon]
MLEIRWHGHSCFEISNKYTLITDPHDGKSIGIPTPMVTADMVLVSHNHYDHNSTKTVANENTTIITDKRKRTIHNISLKGIPTYHDICQGEKRGENTIFLFTIEDITFCHLGDLGHVLSEKQIESLGTVDILFIPVGGTYTLDIDKTWDLISKINPRIIVPMHYKIEGLSLPIAPVDTFLSQAPYDVLKVGNQIDIEPEDLPKNPEVWVFTL